MAWIQDRPQAGEATVDLHGYSVDTAMAVANRIVRDAYRQGYTSITFIHGAADALSTSQSLRTGRGSIKWALRDLVSRDWRPYLRGRRHRGHRFTGPSMTLALQSNPGREPRTGLGDVPPPDYDQER